jgi:hypothetical protein
MNILKLTTGLSFCHYSSGKCSWSLVHVQEFLSGVKVVNPTGKKYILKLLNNSFL